MSLSEAIHYLEKEGAVISFDYDEFAWRFNFYPMNRTYSSLQIVALALVLEWSTK